MRIADHQELVVRKRARRGHAVVDVAHAKRCASVRILVVALVLDAAVAQNDVRALAERLQQRDQFRIVEFKQRREDMAAVAVGVAEQADQLVADRPAEKIAGLVARRRDDRLQRLARVRFRQKPRKPLTRDDAAIEIAGDSAFGRRADFDHVRPRRRVRLILLQRIRLAHHRGDAIGNLVAWADHEIRPQVLLDRPFRRWFASARGDLGSIGEADPARHQFDGEAVVFLDGLRAWGAAWRPHHPPGQRKAAAILDVRRAPGKKRAVDAWTNHERYRHCPHLKSCWFQY